MLNLSKNMRFLPYLLIAPSFVLICVFKLYPIAITLLGKFSVRSAFDILRLSRTVHRRFFLEFFLDHH